MLVVSALGKVFRVDSEQNPAFPIRAGDQILVPLSTDQNTILVLGAVKSPGSLPYVSGETLEKAIQRAGGLSGHALEDQVAVVRRGATIQGADWTSDRTPTVVKQGMLFVQRA